MKPVGKIFPWITLVVLLGVSGLSTRADDLQDNSKQASDYLKILSDFQRTKLLSKAELAAVDKVLESMGDGYRETIMKDVVFGGDGFHQKTVSLQGSQLYPTNVVPRSMYTNLFESDTDFYIHGVRQHDGGRIELFGRDFLPFYISTKRNVLTPGGPKNYLTFTGPSIKRPFLPDQERKLSPNTIREYFKTPPFIKQNEQFVARHGVLGNLLDVNGTRFRAAPIKYMDSICTHIAEEKLDPVIGLWKLKQFTRALFSVDDNSSELKPVLGHSWDYGIPSSFSRKFNDDLVKAYPRGLESYSWIFYYPADSKKKSDLKEREKRKNDLQNRQAIGTFAKDFRGFSEKLIKLREIHDDAVKQGLLIIGYWRNGKPITHPDAPKKGHRIGLVAENKWGIVLGPDKKQPMNYSPLFILKSKHGRETPIPEINKDWFVYPDIFQYQTTQKSSPEHPASEKP